VTSNVLKFRRKRVEPEALAAFRVNCRRLLADHDTTHEKVAFKAGLATLTVRRLANGEAPGATIRTVESIAKVFGLTAAEMLSGVPPSEDEQTWLASIRRLPKRHRVDVLRIMAALSG